MAQKTYKAVQPEFSSSYLDGEMRVSINFRLGVFKTAEPKTQAFIENLHAFKTGQISALSDEEVKAAEKAFADSLAASAAEKAKLQKEADAKQAQRLANQKYEADKAEREAKEAYARKQELDYIKSDAAAREKREEAAKVAEAQAATAKMKAEVEEAELKQKHAALVKSQEQ